MPGRRRSGGLARHGVPTESPTAQSERKRFLPCDHEYRNLKGTKLSKSRGAFVEVHYFLSRYDPDPLRFYLTATAPETRDTEFSWEDFVERNNPVLSPNEGPAGGHLGQPGPTPKGTWVRPRGLGFMLSFAYKRFDGQVPEPGDLDDEDRALLAQIDAGFETVGELYNACKFRAALNAASGLAHEVSGDTCARSLRAREPVVAKQLPC